MHHPAIVELQKIVDCEDRNERTKKLQEWMERSLVEVEKTQLVLNRSRLSMEEHDFACEYVAKGCVEELIEQKAVNFVLEKNCYSAKMLAFKTCV